MGSFPLKKGRALSCITIVIIQSMAQTLNAEIDHQTGSGPVQGHCTSDDLNHSVLIECDDSNCKDANSKEAWPENRKEVIHVYSTRAGERFVVDKLPNLDYQEPEQVRMFDINNTLYVMTLGESKKQMGIIRGFGTTINTEKLLAQMEKGSFDRNYEFIMRDLFGLPPSGNGFTILRLPITRATLLSDKNNNIPNLISKLDSWALKMVYNVDPKTKIKIIVGLEDLEGGIGLYDSLVGLSKSFQDCKTCWAVAINKDVDLRKDMLQPSNLRSLFGTDNLFGVTNVTCIKQDPGLLQALYGINHESSGILVKTEFSSVYNILGDLKKLYPQNMLTIGGYTQQVVEYGDWQNAKNYAVAILNSLKHGSNGFIEEVSDIDILRESRHQDSSIYSLRSDYNVHFRGPMYYAIGHFSRHLAEGSELLETSVITAPNMFAAHYGAFKVRDRAVVAIILNDNEHFLPFRLAVDGRIKAFTLIKPKSFNTFVIDENK